MIAFPLCLYASVVSFSFFSALFALRFSALPPHCNSRAQNKNASPLSGWHFFGPSCYFFPRLRNTIPAIPLPNSSRLAGSGVGTGDKKRVSDVLV